VAGSSGADLKRGRSSSLAASGFIFQISETLAHELRLILCSFRFFLRLAEEIGVNTKVMGGPLRGRRSALLFFQFSLRRILRENFFLFSFSRARQKSERVLICLQEILNGKPEQGQHFPAAAQGLCKG
jgi:hypothetical protein